MFTIRYKTILLFTSYVFIAITSSIFTIIALTYMQNKKIDANYISSSNNEDRMFNDFLVGCLHKNQNLTTNLSIMLGPSCPNKYVIEEKTYQLLKSMLKKSKDVSEIIEIIRVLKYFRWETSDEQTKLFELIKCRPSAFGIISEIIISNKLVECFPVYIDYLKYLWNNHDLETHVNKSIIIESIYSEMNDCANYWSDMSESELLTRIKFRAILIEAIASAETQIMLGTNGNNGEAKNLNEYIKLKETLESYLKYSGSSAIRSE